MSCIYYLLFKTARHLFTAFSHRNDTTTNVNELSEPASPQLQHHLSIYADDDTSVGNVADDEHSSPDTLPTCYDWADEQLHQTFGGVKHPVYEPELLIALCTTPKILLMPRVAKYLVRFEKGRMTGNTLPIPHDKHYIKLHPQDSCVCRNEEELNYIIQCPIQGRRATIFNSIFFGHQDGRMVNAVGDSLEGLTEHSTLRDLVRPTMVLQKSYHKGQDWAIRHMATLEQYVDCPAELYLEGERQHPGTGRRRRTTLRDDEWHA
ncbi:hypothetical protein H2198_003263 [Neophaeococcomyces mojaviensis]|uniref:Uncharacterized protein n=1 Tax=Neophaeococcomyces mojaviensis TaxID=3383035 RepID=A0ACC3ABW0_9EURO|nr:hypothetical protein H2198_003263 [Knufia sp. JES_112]